MVKKTKTSKKAMSLGNLKDIKKRQQAWARAEKKCKDLRKLEDEAWAKFHPEALRRFKEAAKVNKGIWDDFLPEGLGGTEIDLVDSAGQKIDFRVGPVFGKKGIYKEPAIWIGYQRNWMSSKRQGDLLISPNIWRRLVREIEVRLKEYSPKGYGPSKVITIKKKKGKKL